MRWPCKSGIQELRLQMCGNIRHPPTLRLLTYLGVDMFHGIALSSNSMYVCRRADVWLAHVASARLRSKAMSLVQP